MYIYTYIAFLFKIIGSIGPIVKIASKLWLAIGLRGKNGKGNTKLEKTSKAVPY